MISNYHRRALSKEIIRKCLPKMPHLWTSPDRSTTKMPRTSSLSLQGWMICRYRWFVVWDSSSMRSLWKRKQNSLLMFFHFPSENRENDPLPPRKYGEIFHFPCENHRKPPRKSSKKTRCGCCFSHLPKLAEPLKLRGMAFTLLRQLLPEMPNLAAQNDADEETRFQRTEASRHGKATSSRGLFKGSRAVAGGFYVLILASNPSIPL